MVISNYPNWPRLMRQIGRNLLVLFVLSVAAVLMDAHGHILKWITIPDMAISILGAVLGILIGFRTSSAYGRWWEARTLWGALVNSSRTIARQAVSFPRRTGDEMLEAAGAEFTESFVLRQVAFVHAVRCSLRRQPVLDVVAPFLDRASLEDLRGKSNVPNAILQQMGVQMSRAVEEGILSDFHLLRIDATLTDLSNVLGACERIKNTPLPRQYDFYPELLIKVYCLVLPFVIVDEVGVLTPLLTTVVSFAFLVLNRIGKNLEDPFENLDYDVPLTALSKTIEINLKQSVGMQNTPEPEPVVNGVLY